MGTMASGGRERRAAKKRRRDERRGFRAGDDTGTAALGRGLPPETLRRVLRGTAEDLAAGREGAVTELRHVLVEHLARRRGEILTACDEVLASAGETDTYPDTRVGTGPEGGAEAGVAAAGEADLAEELSRGGTVAGWADRRGRSTEDAVLATVRRLARLT